MVSGQNRLYHKKLVLYKWCFNRLVFSQEYAASLIFKKTE